MNLLAVPRQCDTLVGVYGQEKLDELWDTFFMHTTDQRYGKLPLTIHMDTVRLLARHLTRCEIAPQKHCLSATHGDYGIMNLLAVPRQCGALVGVYGQEKVLHLRGVRL